MTILTSEINAAMSVDPNALADEIESWLVDGGRYTRNGLRTEEAILIIAALRHECQKPDEQCTGPERAQAISRDTDDARLSRAIARPTPPKFLSAMKRRKAVSENAHLLGVRSHDHLG